MTAAADTIKLPVNPAHFLKLVEELSALLELEPKLFRAQKRADHADLLKRKQRLMLDYDSAYKALTLEPETLKNLPDNLRITLKQATLHLAHVVENNARALHVALKGTQNLVQGIIAAVREEQLPKQTYTNPQAQLAGQAYRSLVKPVAVNRTI